MDEAMGGGGPANMSLLFRLEYEPTESSLLEGEGFSEWLAREAKVDGA